jgi:hypothetical protein
MYSTARELPSGESTTLSISRLDIHALPEQTKGAELLLCSLMRFYSSLSSMF